MKTFKDVSHSFECKSLFLNMRLTWGIDSGFIGKHLKVVLRVRLLLFKVCSIGKKNHYYQEFVGIEEIRQHTKSIESQFSYPPDDSYIH